MGHDGLETTQKYYANFRESKVLEDVFRIKNQAASESVQ